MTDPSSTSNSGKLAPSQGLAPVNRREALLLATGLTGLVAGCGPEASVEAHPRELLVVDVPHPTKRDPASNGQVFARMGVTETLLDADDEGRPLPGLAASWTASDDRREWRFTLRPGARFHDGTAVTPADIVRALDRARARPGVLELLQIESVAGEDDQVVLRLREPSILPLAVLSHHTTVILASASFDATDRAIDVLGTGPYRLAESSEQEITVERWDGWSGPRPPIERARYLSASRAEARGLLGESGQGDLIFGLDPASAMRLRARSDVTVVDVQTPRVLLLKFNASHPYLADARARRALSLAIDRQGISSGLFRDLKQPATHLIPPSVSEWRLDDLAPLRTDPAEANRLLQALGWSPGSDGVLVRQGQRFSLELRTYASTPELPLIATAVQQQFRQIGVEVSIVIGTPADVPAAHRDGSLQIALINRTYRLFGDPLAVLLQDFGRDGGDWGAMGWHDPVVVAALEQLARGVEPERAAALRGDIVRTLQAELPMAPVIFYSRTVAVSRRVANVLLDPLERSYRVAKIDWAAR
jgi:peptide/nickel transport system substrate-binding protein